MKHIFFVIIFTPLYLFSQEKDLPAQVIFHKGFVEKGFVRYKAWINNPPSMIYTGDDKVQELLLPEDVKQITIEGKDIYIGIKVQRFDNPIETRDINYYEEEPAVTESLFLRLLSTGSRLSLYAYKDAQKSHYFIRDSSGNITTLRFVRFYKDDQGSISLQERTYYREQLKPFIQQGDDKTEKLLSGLRWREDDMIKLVKQINQDESMSYADKELEDNRRQQRFILGAAAAYASFSLESTDRNLGKMSFTSTLNPLIYAGYRFSGRRKTARLSFQLMASFYGYKITGIYDGTGNDGEDIREQLVIKTRNLVLSFELLYALVKKENFSWEIGPGFQFVYPLSLSSTLTSTELNIYGEPIYVEPFPLPQSAHINYSIVNQFHRGNHSLRFVFSPYQKMADMGISIPRDRLISLGYNYNFRL